MDMIENLLCPQVCMDVDDTPLQIVAPTVEPEESPEAHLCTLPASLRARLILDNQFTFKPEQLPHPLNTIEKSTLIDPSFSEVEYLQKAKLHCTVCNVHIGTSLIEQLNRYIHPVLNTLMCYSCYEFYGIGEFEKDEDGSEIYCKWCGQGGVVICCSVCSYVFCSTCVKRNLGALALTQIRTIEEWHCFLCDSKQLSKFRVTAHVLHEYSVKQLKLAVTKRDIIMVKDDISTCCKRKKRKTLDSDEEFVPERKKKPKQVASIASTTNKNKPETPPPQPNLFQTLQLQSNAALAHAPIVKFHVSSESALPALATLMPSLLKAILPPGTTSKEPIQIQCQPNIQVVSSKSKIKLDWLMKAVGTARVQGHNLLTEIEKVQYLSRSAQNYQDLANMHNQLQRILASCTAKLVMARKDMHHAFLKYLTLNRISHTSIPNDINSPFVMSATTLDNISPRVFNNSQSNEPIDLCDDDDDVVSASNGIAGVKGISDCVPVDITNDSDTSKSKPPELKIMGLSIKEYNRAISAKVALIRHDFSKRLARYKISKLTDKKVEVIKVIKKRRGRPKKAVGSVTLIGDSPERRVSKCQESLAKSDLDGFDDLKMNVDNKEIKIKTQDKCLVNTLEEIVTEIDESSENITVPIDDVTLEKTTTDSIQKNIDEMPEVFDIVTSDCVENHLAPVDTLNQKDTTTAHTSSLTEGMNSQVTNESITKEASVLLDGSVADESKTFTYDINTEETVESVEITPKILGAVENQNVDLNIEISNNSSENIENFFSVKEKVIDSVQDTKIVDTGHEAKPETVPDTVPENRIENTSQEIMDKPTEETIDSVGESDINILKHSTIAEVSSSFDFVREMQNEIHSTGNNSPLISEINIEQQNTMDIDNNDNVQSQNINEEVQYVMYSGDDSLASNTGDEVISNSVLDVASPAITLDEMVKIYE